MTKTRSTGRDRQRAALFLSSMALLSVLCWWAGTVIFARLEHRALLPLAMLMVFAFRQPLLGRILGWGGLLAQIASLLIAL
jgi:hypothetical protein